MASLESFTELVAQFPSEVAGYKVSFYKNSLSRSNLFCISTFTRRLLTIPLTMISNAIIIVLFKDIFDSADPHQQPLPGKWNDALDDFQKLIVLKCLRPDKITNAMQDYVAKYLGQRFIEPQVQ